ncbi:MAG: methenyltetrahydromethanopterin cyclohydrolase, partial [Halobacteriaceae archaeon]
MESLNRRAIELADEAIDFAEELHIGSYELDNGTTVLDFGLDHQGGIEAGLLLTEILTAGLATVQTRMDAIVDTPRPYVEISSDDAALAFLCSSKGGWELTIDGFEGLGAGPVRALVAEEMVFHEIGYADAFDLGVCVIETNDVPTSKVASNIADRANVDDE